MTSVAAIHSPKRCQQRIINCEAIEIPTLMQHEHESQFHACSPAACDFFPRQMTRHRILADYFARLVRQLVGSNGAGLHGCIFLLHGGFRRAVCALRPAVKPPPVHGRRPGSPSSHGDAIGADRSPQNRPTQGMRAGDGFVWV